MATSLACELSRPQALPLRGAAPGVLKNEYIAGSVWGAFMWSSFLYRAFYELQHAKRAKKRRRSGL
jgi:hypothetical protein